MSKPDDDNPQMCLAIDFGGVIHPVVLHGQPIDQTEIPGAISGLIQLVEWGYYVYVFTSNGDLDAVAKWLDDRLPHHIAKSVEVVRKKPRAIAYIDDRAIRFINWADTLAYFTRP